MLLLPFQKYFSKTVTPFIKSKFSTNEAPGETVTSAASAASDNEQ